MSEQLGEEIEALDAIYPESLIKDGGLYKLIIPESDIKLQMSFPSSYPDKPPRILSATKLEGALKDTLYGVFVPGQVCIFDFLESVRELVEGQEEEEMAAQPEPEPKPVTENIFEGWIESDPIVDRKSIFVARAAHVTSAEEAMAKVEKLKVDKKIARATHNITSWRTNGNNIITQDCDDDGETAAGGRLLHLLQLTDCWNVVVCVSRWFGGIHLGPDRFKHINSSGRDALVKGGFITEKKK